MKRYENEPNKAIKRHYEELRVSVGRTSKSIAEELKITRVTLCTLSTRLDQMTASQLYRLAAILGVDPGKFLKNIIGLRKNENYEVEL